MKSFLLVLASLLLGLLLCEAALRLFTGYRPSRSTESAAVPGPVEAKPVTTPEAMPYVERLPAAPGTDRRWFTEDPPPLSNRAPVGADRAARYKDYQQRGLFPDQADYIWNRYYVEGTRCAPTSLFRNYPDNVLAFDPPAPASHPIFRFPPNTTGVAGLVTNEFGLRGPAIGMAKPPRTIRIAFIGASTTVGFHHFPFSYPEYVSFWLNRYAAANHLDVRFEMLNAGREGINSEDIAAIVRDELLPLDPDLAVYYEGANQFPSANLLVSPHIAPRVEIGAHDPIARHVVPAAIRAHLAIGDLIDRAVNGFSAVGEPRKPAYRLMWPHGVDKQDPNVDDPKLPLQLPRIVHDLDAIRSSLKTAGGELVLCSFEWYSNDRIALSRTRHKFIYEQLNTVLWPLRYADIRRLANFQNRVFRRYAASRGIPFLDVAANVPEDPDLFVDAIHMTETGERLKAWIVFQQLAPLVRRKIESGELPRPAGSHPLPPAPSLTAFPASIRCEDPRGPFTRVDGVVSLETLQVHNNASVQKGPPLKLVAPAGQGAFALGFPLRMPERSAGAGFLYLRGRVLNGRVTLGILDQGASEFQIEKGVDPSPELIDIYVPILFPERAGALIVRNAADGNVPSGMLIQDVALMLGPRRE
ncbi:MAG: hypothetical protein LAP38_17190 [Acidobacteriia bacterium]|nr:hypothetical protein [Terriglobia bacterium]